MNEEMNVQEALALLALLYREVVPLNDARFKNVYVCLATSAKPEDVRYLMIYVFDGSMSWANQIARLIHEILWLSLIHI